MEQVAARAAVAEVLRHVKGFLAQEAPPRLSEADTKANFIEPIIAALGWTGIGTVVREYYVRNSQEFIDYVMYGAGKPLLAVEAKPLQTDLTEKHAAQLVQYCAVEGIEWAALTNGRELQFFNTYLKPDLSAKRFLRLDLLAFNNDDEFEVLFGQIWLLSRESMTTPSGVRTWLEQKRMDTALRSILLDPTSPAVRSIRKALTEAEVKAGPQEITQWFRTHLNVPVAIVPYAAQPYAKRAELSVLLPFERKAEPPQVLADPNEPTTAPLPPRTRSPQSAPSKAGERVYLLTPVSDDEELTAEAIIRQLLDSGYYVFGERTAGRNDLKPGDRICFYQSGVGVVAEAEVASLPERKNVPVARHPDKYPWSFQVTNVRYFFEQPVILDAQLRAQLDAFKGRDPEGPWAWFVQGTHKVSDHDFVVLTRGYAASTASR